MCYAIGALALDLVWGYCGILSLGHALFFALGGYAMGMYLMRSIGREGNYRATCPTSWCSSTGTSCRGTGKAPSISGMRCCWWCWCPAMLAWVFGFFTFRSRVKGVYLSIITQAMTFAAMLLFYRNETGFGGNNGFTDFKRIAGFPITHPGTRTALFLITFAVLILAFIGARAIVTSKLGRVVTGVRDGEARLMFLGYSPLAYKLFIWTVSAVLCGIAGALYVPQVGIINPSEMSPGELDRDGDLGRGGRTRHVDRTDHRRVRGEWREELLHGEFPRILAVFPGPDFHARAAVCCRTESWA